MSDTTIEKSKTLLQKELLQLKTEPDSIAQLSDETKEFLVANDCLTSGADQKLKYEIIEANGLVYLVDSLNPELKEGENPVYPFHDEATEILRVAKSLHANFDTVIDAFRGGGHSTLPIIDNGIASKAKSIDINPRAQKLANINAQINGYEDKVDNIQGDTKKELPPKEGKTLFVANPPFALAAKGVQLAVMRDGGENGLVLTNAYLDKSLAAAEEADWVIGVAYSRISADGRIELEESIKEKIGSNCKYEVKLIENATLWRGPDGEKRQPNPMPLSQMYTKALPTDTAAIDAYNQAASYHLEQGWEKLGYFEYRIYIGGTETIQKSTRDAVYAVMGWKD